MPLALHLVVALPELGHLPGDVQEGIRLGAVDAFNFTAGPTEFLELARLAQAAGMPFWLGSQIDLGVLEALYVHTAAAAAGSLWPCDIFGRLIRSHDLLETPLSLQPPQVHLPEGPGLGVGLDEEALDSFTTRREEVAA